MAALIEFKKVANDPPFGTERVNMVALTIVLTTSGQKPSRASFISDGFEAGGEEEERLISKLVQVSLETQKFADRPRHFVYISMDECHIRPKCTGHCTALPFRDLQSTSTEASASNSV